MPIETIWTVIAVAAVVAALALLVLAVAAFRLVGSARRFLRTADRTVGVLQWDLPPTLEQVRRLTANLERLTAELQPRVERMDVLLDEADATLVSLRATVEAAEEIVRGPIDAVERARRAVRSVGVGLAAGADQLRRRVEDVSGRRDHPG